MNWANPAEIERKRRIKVAMWAYAYEVLDKPMVDDATFDKEAAKIDLSIATDRPTLDAWFRENFDPCSGMWIHSHPELDKLREHYAMAIAQQA